MSGRYRLKVVHILALGGYSGAENVVLSIIKGTEEFCDSVYLSPHGEIDDILKERKIMHYSMDDMSITSIQKAIMKMSPDIIHAHDFNNSVKSAIGIRGIPIISHLHNNPPWIKTVSAKSISYLLTARKYAQILAVSDSISEEYVFRRFLKQRPKTIGNPINIKNIIDKADDKRTVNRVQIAFLGRLSPQKNPLSFLHVVYDVKEVFQDVQAVIIGDGELRKDVEKAILELDLSDNVQCVGFIRNPYNILKESTLLCMTSDWEGFGLAAVEALALGVPVVCRSVGGLKNIVNSECGYVCNSDKEITDGVLSILLDDNVYVRLREGALSRARELDNYDAYMKEIKDIYTRISS